MVPFIHAGGLTVHADISGPHDAPPIVFANSLGTNLHIWDAQAAALADRYRIVRYDMRGHGMTSFAPPGEDYAIARLADDLAALLDALRIERASVVGLSIGGMVAQRFAAAYPQRVDALVLCATGNRIGSADTWNARIEAVTTGGMSAIVDGVLGRWFTPATHADRPDLVRGFSMMAERTPVPGYAGCCAAIRDADLRADDARITARTLVISGAADVVTPPASGAQIRDAIPRARLEVIDDAAHMLCAERPEALDRLLGGFIGATASAGSTR
jgi:3-oxoadipate enol-lactonase